LRRDSQTTAYGGTTTYLNDQKNVAQSSNSGGPSNPINNYLTMPGTGEVLAFATTTTGNGGGGTSTFVPLQDGQGSTIGLVNSSNVLQTQFTYDPWGNVSTSGTASQYPYLFKGMEYDATGFYHAGTAYYSPELGRPLQQVIPGGGGGGGGGMGVSASVPSSSGGGGLGGVEDRLANNATDLAIGAAAGGAGAFLASFITINEMAVPLGPVFWVVAGVADAILGILDFFGLDFFGGGNAPVIPPGYYRHAHYVESQFIGCDSVTVNQDNSARPEASSIVVFGIAGEATAEGLGLGIGVSLSPVVVVTVLVAAGVGIGVDIYTHFAKGGKQRYDNEYTEQAKQQANPCEWLRVQYNSTKNSAERKKITLAQKYLGCKRSTQNRE
jgi:RHS repeat-associated protein